MTLLSLGGARRDLSLPSFGGLGRLATTHALLPILAFIALGAAVVVMPVAAIVGVLAIYAILRGQLILRDALTFLLLGAVVLNYGFANVGFDVGNLPVPLTEIVLLPLVVFCLVQPNGLRALGKPGLFLIGFLALATLRLIVDVPHYGSAAVRDFTMPIEATALIVGFCAFNRYGLKWAMHLWMLVSVAVMLYSLLYPVGPNIADAGPTVGLQQPVALFGQYANGGAALSSSLFMFLLRVPPPLSYILGAATLAVAAMLQSRGVYIVIPAVALLVVVAARRLKTRVFARLATSMLVGFVLLLFVVPFAPNGRLGPLDLSFAVAQIGTLAGKAGPGDGSYKDRIEWMNYTWQQQKSHPSSLVWGLGLGRDLTNGFRNQGVTLVRKPHDDYLEVLARYGAVGFVLWGGILVTTLLPIWRGIRSERLPHEERMFLLWMLASAASYLLLAATQPALSYPYGTIPLFTILGMGYALATKKRDAPAETEETAVEAEAANRG